MKRKPDETRLALELAIKENLDAITAEYPGSPEYVQIVSHLTTLVDCHQKLYPVSKPIDKSSLIAASANILGIGVILTYERLNVIATKAIGFVSKIRL